MTADTPPRPRAPSSRGEPLLSQLAGRTVLVITVLAILFAACGAVALASSTGTLSAPSSEDSDPGLTSGRPFQDPPDADLSAAVGKSDGDRGVLTITLDPSDMRYELSGGTWAWGQSYEGSATVPTLHLPPGAQVSVRLVNHLPDAAKVRFHGLALSQGGEALCVAPGASLMDLLAVPANHPQGTYWYHSHVLATPCPAEGRAPPGSVDKQARRGLSGALIVGDDRASLPRAYRDVAAHTFVLQAAGGQAADCLVNGELRPVLGMRPNETQLWRLVNAGMDATYRLQLDGYRFTVVAEDGAPLAGVTSADSVLLPPGKRFDVLVTARDHPGDTWLRTTTTGADADGDQYPDSALVHVAVAGRAVGRLPSMAEQG
ncbi:MAG: multicopper oxidase family protein [Catenulispora sp.]|nr:multicopper oxidase family protein [Catenulispora sp.]